MIWRNIQRIQTYSRHSLVQRRLAGIGKGLRVRGGAAAGCTFAAPASSVRSSSVSVTTLGTSPGALGAAAPEPGWRGAAWASEQGYTYSVLGERAEGRRGLHFCIRVDRILPVLDPSIRELIKKQEFFQVLESWEPRLGQSSPGAPVGERNFEI